MGYLTRTPTSNDPTHRKNPYGGDELMDDTALLLSGTGNRCTGCKKVTKNNFLDQEGRCPDCCEERP